MNNQLISVIVPAYNVGKTISRCLESILSQTYNHIEVIVVNDCSTDNTVEIVHKYCQMDSRVRLLNHKKNLGLFAARITGVKESCGDYIGFVDSDDYISRDYYRELIYEAINTESDIVVSKFAHEDINGYQWIHNIYEEYEFGRLHGSDIWEKYWEQEGQLFIWHTVWNKLYSRRLWEKSIEKLSELKSHLIMAEDFVFSTVLFYNAESLSSVKYSRYYYYKNENSSTAINNDYSKIKKNITDLVSAFAFVKEFLLSSNSSKDVIRHFQRWESLYKYFWNRNIINSEIDEKEKTKLISILDSGLLSADIPMNPDYFYKVSTKFNNRYEEIVNDILNKDVKVVSFDVFDTALVRNLYRPSDVFELMELDASRKNPQRAGSISKIRVEAEEIARKKYIDDKATEEISLDQIYDEMSESFKLSDAFAKELKISEMEMEKRFISKRDSIYNLYQIALSANKKIVFTSDMYLSAEIVNELLNANGFSSFDKLFLSSDLNATKRTGKLFEIIKEHYGCDFDEIIHIGDSWDCDYISANKTGIKARFYPKTVECLEYGISDIYSSHAMDGYKGRRNSFINFEYGLRYLGNRSAIAIVANRLFDMPFKSYNPNSEMNASPQFLGYFALGMHILGLSEWIYKKCIEKKYENIVFVARDGYLPMKAFQIIKKFHNHNEFKEKYFYTSRKAAIPCGYSSFSDLYGLYDDISRLNIKKAFLNELLSPVINVDMLDNTDSDELIMSRSDFCKYINEKIQPVFDEEKANRFNEQLYRYFDKFFSNKSVLVDVGYSGRTQELIYKVLNRKIDGLYVHKNSDDCMRRESIFGFMTSAYYDFTPSITGAQRELLLSSLEPSCIKYDVSDLGIEPTFEKQNVDYPYIYLINETQRTALQFVKDYCDCFSVFMDDMYMRNVEISYPFEHMLAYAEDSDLDMFSCVLFEDDMWAGENIALSNKWREDIEYHKLREWHYQNGIQKIYVHDELPESNDGPLAWRLYNEKNMRNRNLLSKFLFWLVNDKKFLLQRMRSKLLSHD